MHNGITKLSQLLGAREVARVLKLAKKQDMLEGKWRRIADSYLTSVLDGVLERSKNLGALTTEGVDFAPLMMRHSYAVIEAGIKSTKRMTPIRAERLASVPKKGLIPKSLKALREWWDRYRKTGILPKRQKAEAEKLKAYFLEKLQATWRRHAQDFLLGNTASQQDAERGIKKALGVAASRARMIVNTETTYYFNNARREIYDNSPDVTHYLSIAIRDHATTKWCKTRDGLVYAKDDPLTEKEFPPSHWNCRREMLPLTPLNPNHAKLIQDKDRQRRRNKCEPLPAGWTGRKNLG